MFATSIYDNIKHGLIGTTQEHESEKAVRELVDRAAKMANVSTANGIKSPLRHTLYAKSLDEMMF